MSATNENITLIGIKLDGAEAGGVIDKLTDSLKNLIQEKEKLVATDEEALKQKALLEDQIKKEEEALKKTKQAIESEEGSINKLREANKKLTQERNATSTSTEEGRKKVRALNDQIDKNNALIKDNIDATTKQRMSIDRTVTNLNELNIGYVKSAQGMWGMVKAAWAFVATPIGAILAALAAVLGAVVVFLKNTAGGMDFMEDSAASLSAILDVVIDRIGKFVGGVLKLLSGDIKGGFSDLKDSITGIGDELEREVRLARELAAAIRDLEDAEINYRIAASETENQIKQLLLQSKNRTASEMERIAFLNQALKLEQDLNKIAIANANEALRIANDQANQRINLTRLTGETELDFSKRILLAFQEGKAQADELRDAVVDAFEKRQKVEGDSLALQEKILNQTDALIQKSKDRADKEKEAAEKAEAANQKYLADQEKMNQQAIQNEKEMYAAFEEERKQAQEAEEQGMRDTLDFQVQVARSEQEIQEQKHQEELQRIEDRKAALQGLAEFSLNLLSMQSRTASMETNADLSRVKAAEQKKMEALDKRFKSGLISEDAYNTERDKITEDSQKREREIKKKAFDANKKNQIAGTIISTLQSGVNAYNSMVGIPYVGPVLGAIAAAAALFFGYKQVDAIRRTEFTYAKGGRAGVSGTRINSRHGVSADGPNGDNLLAYVRTGEVILNERQQRALGGPSTFARIGVPGFANGGFTGGTIETFNADRNGRLEREVSQLRQDMQQVRTVLVLQDFEAAEAAKNSVEVKSTL